MTKTVGFYGGKFLPVHRGHVFMMIEASTMVDELYIIVSYDEEYEKKLCKMGGKIEHIPYQMRVRWWNELTKDMSHVKVHAIEEKQTGEFDSWEQGSIKIKEVIGKPITHVFSSEREYDEYFSKLYPEADHVVIDPKRRNFNISATAIRHEGTSKHWDNIPKVVQPYFVKKVVIVGTESCGKSTLVKNLANLYNTSYVEEYGRTFYERIGAIGNVTLPEDYPEIAFEHKYHERVQRQKANRVLFVDTEAIVTQYYSDLYLGEYHDILDSLAKNELNKYDLWLYLEPDVKWVDDGSRVHGEKDIREENSERLKSMLHSYNVDFKTIKGNYAERLNKSMKHINEIL